MSSNWKFELIVSLHDVNSWALDDVRHETIKHN